MKHVLSIAIIVSTILFVACNKCPRGIQDPDCICPQVYEPVCGCDGQTYGNECQATCADIQEFTEGAC